MIYVRRHAGVFAAILFLAGASAVCIIGCKGRGKSGSNAAPSDKPEIILYCGAGIRPAVEDLIEAFEPSHDVTISATYAGSGRLLGQLVSSRVGDLFMPGSAFYVDQAIAKGLADPNTSTTVAYFVPVIVVQKGNPLGVTSLGDLAEKSLRLGLGDERAVAVGRQARRLFEKNDIAYDLIEKNAVYRSGTVNELGVAMQMKNIDVAIMWDANARQFSEALEIVDIPLDRNLVAAIPIVALKFSRYPDRAREFIRFATSSEGAEILRQHNYTVELGP